MDDKIEKGMFLSDRCQFCYNFNQKEKPYLCPDCWKRIKEIISEYKDELCPEVKELEASLERTRDMLRQETELSNKLEAENAKLNESRQSWKDNCQCLEYTRLKLEASNEKLRKAMDAIYDPNCDCYLCVTFREALEE